jgi:hypothetical protein
MDYEKEAKSKAIEHTNDVLHFYDTLKTDPATFQREYCLLQATNQQNKMKNWKKTYCELCHQELNGEQQWEEHRKTRKHKGLTKRREKQLAKQEEQRQQEPSLMVIAGGFVLFLLIGIGVKCLTLGFKDEMVVD